MEGEVGAQVTPPVIIQQSLPSVFHGAPPVPKKRDSSWQNGSFHPKTNNSWNPKQFTWDSVGFSVKPSSNGEESSRNAISTKGVEEEGGTLTLKLGGGGAKIVEEDRPAIRPSKKVRSGSPGSSGGGNYPMCQVDDCKTDLSNAKDYHRRHKVCEVHGKATKAIVSRQMQRFCQQCSRFHPLSEFDEGKRSCRRRLAGHNRRRRKTQLADASSHRLSHGNQGTVGNENLDVVKLLAILARLQGADKVAGSPMMPDKDQINQIISKIHSLQAAKSASKTPVTRGFDLNVSQVSEQSSFEHPTKINGKVSTMDLLAAASTTLASSAPDTLAAQSQGISERSGYNKANSPPNQSLSIFSSAGSERNRCTLQKQFETSKDHVEKTQRNLQLQLFHSSRDSSPPEVDSTRKCLSSDSSNPMDARSPSSSPVEQRLFPLHSASKSMKHERTSIFPEDSTHVERSTSHGWITPLDLFQKSDKRVENGAVQSIPCQVGYTSSGSDHSPSSLNSDGQDRTGWIIFKLFGKDPNSFPGALKSRILNWLSNSPSEMESYIRPGCVVLSIYASMPSGAWDDLERNLTRRVSSLVRCSESDFWRSGRFLVRTNGQLASHKDGKIHLCKSWKTLSDPVLTSVSPIAVVSGQETSFVLKGCNLTTPGTRIHCTYMGGYISKDVSITACPGTIYESSNMESFSFYGGSLNVFGRCFIEVENGFKGNSFPIIIADALICQELRVLESDFEGGRTIDVLHFLNELGWLFQRMNISSNPLLTDISIKRFNFLLTFSVERDWTAVVRTLLDMLVERSLISNDSLVQESLEMLLEIQLLSRAVKRKCRKMVDFLIHYSAKRSTNDSKVYLFPPNSAGPGGITPLHLAASTQDSQDMVHALTDDPQEIGLNCWHSILDERGQTPYMYASTTNNHSYNELVARKLADKKNDQISLLVEDKGIGSRSCARCAQMDANRFRPMVRNRGLLHRPYIHSMLAIAAVCVCVCVLMRDMPKLSNVAPFMWEHLDYGPR